MSTLLSTADAGLEKANRGASSSAAKIYRKDGLFGPISVGSGPVWPSADGHGVLTWCASPYARHVFGPASILHAVNRPPGGLDGVQYANARLSGLVFHRSRRHIDMACNALEYIFGAPGEAGAFQPVEVRPG